MFFFDLQNDIEMNSWNHPDDKKNEIFFASFFDLQNDTKIDSYSHHHDKFKYYSHHFLDFKMILK